MPRTDEIAGAQARLARWRADPVLFAAEALDLDLTGGERELSQDDWQANFVRAVAANDRVAAASGTGVGKSTALAVLVLWWHVTRFPAKTLVTGAKFEQVKSTLWAEVGTLLKRLPETLRAELDYTSERLTLRSAPSESFAQVQTSAENNAQNLAGWHSKHLLILVDEASAVPPLVFEALEGNMSTVGAKMVLAGNPLSRAGDFADVFLKHPQLWARFNIDGRNVSRVSRSWIERLRLSFGEESNVYRVRVLGRFPDHDDDVLIPLGWVEAAIGRDVEPVDEAPVWGVDCAWQGSDRSALAKRRGNTLLEPVRGWSGLDPAQLAGRIKQEWQAARYARLAPAEIVIDTIGIGAGTFAMLRQEGLPVKSCNVGEAPAIKAQFLRLRDELWWKAREWFQARDCRIPDDQELVNELSSPKFEAGLNGKIRVESKAEMRKRGLRSPDLADAFIMSFHGNPHSLLQQMARRRGVAPVSFPASIWG